MSNNNKKKKKNTVMNTTTTKPPLCRFFVLQRGVCRNGDHCRFSHEIPTNCSSYQEAAKRHIPCPYADNCKYGKEFCLFCHDDDDTVLVVPTEAAEAATTTTTTVCAICLENPLNKKDGDQRFGLLNSCDHVFCFDCIMEWRCKGRSKKDYNHVDETTTRLNRTKDCPTCRVHSDFVVPSRVFATTGTAKNDIITAYKAKLEGIPCKNFTGRLGSCPFGKDCFFAHIDNETGKNIKAWDDTMKEQFERKKRQANNRRRHRINAEMERLAIDLLWLLDMYETSAAARDASFLHNDDDDDDTDEEEFW